MQVDLFGAVDKKEAEAMEIELESLKYDCRMLTESNEGHLQLLEIMATELDWYREKYGDVYEEQGG